MMITRYTREHLAEVSAFNVRLAAGGSSFQYDADPTPIEGLKGVRNVIQPEHFLAIDSGGMVRGAYTIIFQRFCINGSSEESGFLQLPLSEGTVNPEFRSLGARLLTDALRRCPLLFSLGMGGLHNPLPRLFRALGADVREVPFFFQVLRPRSFLRNATVVRNSLARRIACSLAANTGIGTLAFGILNTITGRNSISRRSLRFEVVNEFPAAVDEIWDSVKAHYSCLSIRDRETLHYLYPASDPRYRRIWVREGSEPVGWALVTVSQLDRHPYFGNMRLGALVNCLSLPYHEDLVVAAATAFLRESGVDLIVSNQLHPLWGQALKRDGFLSYRSNFVFAAPKAFAARIRSGDPGFERIHMNRGDGDGAYHL
jgi:hypothetical protein